MQEGYGLWSDSFYNYNGHSNEPQLVAGLLIAVSDGNDTSGVSTLDQVLSTRGTKRTIFIRVGDELDRSVASQIANAGMINAVGGFDGLSGAVEEVTQRVASLNDAIYVAEYCSPKRANAHDLFFTVAGNEDYIGNPSQALCNPSGPGPSCDGSDYYCGPDYSGEYSYLCCAPEFPFMCPNGCYRTQQDASASCGSSCIECGAASDEEGDIGEADTSIEIQFYAGGFSDEQCVELFDEGTGGSGGTGGEPSTGSPACSELVAAARSRCEPRPDAPRANTLMLDSGGDYFELAGDCGAAEFYGCESARDAYLSCHRQSIEDGGYWQCNLSKPASIWCTYTVCQYEFYQLSYCMAAR